MSYKLFKSIKRDDYMRYDKLKRRKILGHKIHQHKGKFGNMPLEEIQERIDYIETFENSTAKKDQLEYYQRQKSKALQILKEKENEPSRK